ncbi:Pentatricopeptide repeat-containing protein [Durusdinium trenchii]|uniref:Chloroplastic n=1 Tax=Durusdinium trenchii TaxID=1381693 RepID=A0ABP0QPZ1_9DINO
MEFPSPGRVGKTPESDGAAARDDLPSQGPHLLAFASRLGPAPPLPPLPPKLEAGSSRGGSEAEEELDDFTPEERRLEQESEEALKQLEALNAAVEALRMKLEVAKDDAECSAAQLLQLNSAADSWAKAAEESRQELKDRELRLQELLAVLPAEDPPVETEESDKHLPGERPPRVLQQQTDRLQEQVEAQQSLLLQRLEERRALEAQVEVLCKERDEQKAVQQKAW